jgi:hypothetical protein
MWVKAFIMMCDLELLWEESVPTITFKENRFMIFLGLFGP